MGFTSLAYLMDMDRLLEAYQRTRKDGAAGVDGMTAAARSAAGDCLAGDKAERQSAAIAPELHARVRISHEGPALAIKKKNVSESSRHPANVARKLAHAAEISSTEKDLRIHVENVLRGFA